MDFGSTLGYGKPPTTIPWWGSSRKSHIMPAKNTRPCYFE